MSENGNSGCLVTVTVTATVQLPPGHGCFVPSVPQLLSYPSKGSIFTGTKVLNQGMRSYWYSLQDCPRGTFWCPVRAAYEVICRKEGAMILSEQPQLSLFINSCR